MIQHPIGSCLTALITFLVLLPDTAAAQLNPSRKARTTASKSDYSTGYNRGSRRPRNYDQHYYNARTGYELSPYLVVPQAASRPITPVAPYSATEYGSMISASLNAHPVVSEAKRPEHARSILETRSTEAGFIQVQATGVLDRGLLLLGSGEQVRLRGVRVFSTTSRDETSKLFAREATRRLQDLTGGEDIFLLLDEPVRDRDGTLLVVAFLADGTDVGQLLLHEGLAKLQEEDFAPETNFDLLKAAESKARENKLGVWSRRM